MASEHGRGVRSNGVAAISAQLGTWRCKQKWAEAGTKPEEKFGWFFGESLPEASYVRHVPNFENRTLLDRRQPRRFCGASNSGCVDLIAISTRRSTRRPRLPYRAPTWLQSSRSEVRRHAGRWTDDVEARMDRSSWKPPTIGRLSWDTVDRCCACRTSESMTWAHICRFMAAAAHRDAPGACRDERSRSTCIATTPTASHYLKQMLGLRSSGGKNFRERNRVVLLNRRCIQDTVRPQA